MARVFGVVRRHILGVNDERPQEVDLLDEVFDALRELADEGRVEEHEVKEEIVADKDRTARSQDGDQLGEVLTGAPAIKPDARAEEPLGVNLVEAPPDHAFEEPAHPDLLAEARLEAVPLLLLHGAFARLVEGSDLDVALPADGHALAELTADELVDQALVPVAQGRAVAVLPVLAGDDDRVGAGIRLPPLLDLPARLVHEGLQLLLLIAELDVADGADVSLHALHCDCPCCLVTGEVRYAVVEGPVHAEALADQESRR